MNTRPSIARILPRSAARRAERVFKLVPLAILLLAALPADAININPAVTNGVPRKRRPLGRDFRCEVCTEKTLATNGCVTFAVAFGRSPLVAEAPVGRAEIFELTAARLPSGADVLRYDHPLMRRIVDEDAAAGLVSVEEGSGWIVVYRDGVPVGWSSGADLAIRRDPATGLWIEQLEDRTLVCYNADNTVDHIVTPAGVRLDWENAGLDVVWDGNAIGQVRSVADGLMDVTKLSPSSFRVSWYPPAAVGERENGRYAATGNPAKTFTFSYSNVGGEHRYALREYRDERFCFDYLWKSGDGLDWTFVKDPDGLAIADAESSTFAAGSTAAEGTRYETHVYSDAAGHTNRTVLAYRYSANGATPVSRSAGSAPAHWSAARAETGPAAGRLVSVTNEWGGVTAKAYDPHGRLLSETTTVFGSLEEATAYVYETNLVDGFPDRRPRHVVVTRDGVVVSDTTYSYDLAIDGGRLDTVTRTDPVSGVSLVSSRLYYPVSSTNAAEAGRIRLSVSEDRTATLYAYAPTANGGYVRTATHGYIAEPDASAPGADASRFAIAPSQSTRTVETVNFRGDVVRVDEFVHTGEEWSPAGWTTYTYNLPHKRTGFADHKGDWESSEWICSGPVWQDLADGTAVTNTFDKAKRLATSTRYTPFGAVTTAYSYDPLGQVVATTVSTNGVAVRGTLAAYDARGRRVLSVDEQGRTNTVTYSADNRIVTSTTQAGAVTTAALNTDGSVSTIAGNVRPYETRSYGVNSATGLFWTEVCTAQNDSSPSVLASRTFRNPLGQTVRYETPAPNNHVRATLSAYNALGQLVSEQTDFLSNGTFIAHSALSIAHSYDALGSLSQTKQVSTSGVWRAQSSSSVFSLEPDGSVWSRDFSVASCSDPVLAALTNRTDRKFYPLSQSERSHVVSYDLRGNATHETESFDRAAARSESSTLVPWAANPSLSVALAGRKVEVVDFASVTNRFEYDSLGHRIAATDGRGNVTTYEYDAAGHLISTTDPADFTTSYAYDTAGRLVATTDTLGNTVHTDYDAAGRVVAESGATYPVRKGYDSYGRWTSLKTTRNGSTWDETQWTYDEASGVQTAKTYADGSVVRYGYDEEGRPTRTTWARGAWFENRYDEWGQIVAVTHDDPTIDAAMAYDAFGRLVVSSNNAAAYRYARDDRGLITNELAVIGGITNVIVRDFDDYGRPSRLRIADSDYDQTYAYDFAGRLSVIGIPGSTVTYAYTPDSLDAGYSVLTPSNAVLTRALTRDPHRRGLILSVSNLVNGVDSGSSFDYTYDALGRPIARNLDEFGYNARGEVAWARYGTNTLADIYEYDFIGNFTSNRLRGSWSQFEENELNEYVVIEGDIAKGLFYDLDGNLLTNGVWSYTYDSHNRLTAVCSNMVMIAKEAYDTSSRRIATESQDQTTIYLYDVWNGIREETIAGSTTNVIDRFWGKDLSGALQNAGGICGLLFEKSACGSFYPSYDNLGNVVGYINVIGHTVVFYIYDAFGNCTSVEGDNASSFRYRFSTKPMENHLYYYGYRFYAPTMGRWMNRDPIDEKNCWNLFSFAFCNGLQYVDRFGLECTTSPTIDWLYLYESLVQDLDPIPCSSFWEMMGCSLLRLPRVSITGDALDAIRTDYQKKLFSTLKNDQWHKIEEQIDRFFENKECQSDSMVIDFDVSELVQLGPKLKQAAIDFLFGDETSLMNGTSPMLTVGKVVVNAKGKIKVSMECSPCCKCVRIHSQYSAWFEDTFDFVPAPYQPWYYNELAKRYSLIAYDTLHASKPSVWAWWHTDVTTSRCKDRHPSPHPVGLR